MTDPGTVRTEAGAEGLGGQRRAQRAERGKGRRPVALHIPAHGR